MGYKQQGWVGRACECVCFIICVCVHRAMDVQRGGRTERMQKEEGER